MMNTRNKTNTAVKSAMAQNPATESELRRNAILRAIPSVGHAMLDGLIGQIFIDDEMCQAYLQVILPKGNETQPMLALNRSVGAMRVAAVNPGLMRHERPVAALLAFLEDAGDYLCQLEGTKSGRKPSDWSLEERRQVREAALYTFMKTLRQRSPAVGGLMDAALGIAGVSDEQGDSDEQQVMRVRAAVEQACRGWQSW